MLTILIFKFQKLTSFLAGEQIRGQKVKGFGMGNIFSGGPIKLKSTAGAKEQAVTNQESIHSSKTADPKVCTV